ncbi:transposase [Ideonella alba]|uniref:transposase n=1 Tax=Ideonella alba TaxID=2824118 RepID=UPI0035BFFE25
MRRSYPSIAEVGRINSVGAVDLQRACHKPRRSTHTHLATSEFISRQFQRVLPVGLQRIRHNSVRPTAPRGPSGPRPE